MFQTFHLTARRLFGAGALSDARDPETPADPGAELEPGPERRPRQRSRQL